MSVESMMNQPCTIWRRLPVLDTAGDPIRDDRGDVLVDIEADEDSFGDPIETVCYAQQRAGETLATEDTRFRDQQSETWLVMLPKDTEVTGSDIVEVDGVRLEVQGPPWPAWSPRLKRTTHIECHGKQVV